MCSYQPVAQLLNTTGIQCNLFHLLRGKLKDSSPWPVFLALDLVWSPESWKIIFSQVQWSLASKTGPQYNSDISFSCSFLVSSCIFLTVYLWEKFLMLFLEIHLTVFRSYSQCSVQRTFLAGHWGEYNPGLLHTCTSILCNISLALLSNFRLLFMWISSIILELAYYIYYQCSFKLLFMCFCNMKNYFKFVLEYCAQIFCIFGSIKSISIW